MSEQFPHLPECMDGVNRIMDSVISKSFVTDGGYGLTDVVRVADVLQALCEDFDVKPSETKFEQYAQ